MKMIFSKIFRSNILVAFTLYVYVMFFWGGKGGDSRQLSCLTDLYWGPGTGRINLYLSTSSLQHGVKTWGQTAVFGSEVFLTQKTNSGILKAAIGNSESCHLADFQNRPCFYQQSYGLCDQSVINSRPHWLVKQSYHEALHAKYIRDTGADHVQTV